MGFNYKGRVIFIGDRYMDSNGNAFTVEHDPKSSKWYADYDNAENNHKFNNDLRYVFRFHMGPLSYKIEE